MRKYYLALCFLAVTCGSLMADPVDLQKAQSIGAKFLSTTVISQKKADIQLDLVSVATNRNAIDYYVFNVSNEAGISHNVYHSVIVGEKCDITFQLHDDGGDGWKGACISVTSESGQRIAIVGMEEGAEKTVTLPLLKGNLNFIWNHGWFQPYPGWGTDDECSFSILNADGEVVYTSADLHDGVFLTYDNDCEPDGTVETDNTESVSLYPNPTSGLINIEGQGTMRISISNILGQKLLEINSEGNTTLDLSRYESGMYFVRIETVNGVTVQKVNVRK